jgi:predicted O-methyltransferase YrrM
MINVNKSLFDSEAPSTSALEIPKRTGSISKIHIKDKLKNLGYELDSFSLGEYDYIGEFTAKKQRSSDKDLFKSVGAFFRPNYERGLLINSLIRKYDIKSYLEIGYGRGYSCFCAAKTMTDLGRGTVTSVDPALNQEQIQNLSKVFPHEWFEKVAFYKETSDDFFKANQEKFDMIYIDGDHRYDAVKNDWENAKNAANKVILFDDYHLPGKVQKDIEVSSLIDSIEGYDKELVIMDRRIFLDDRGYTDDQIDYGQVIITK